tara:strand:- start:8060 stop:8419 length:360 start_codon:yes stop_codon:yes gene_type:complete
MKLRTDFKYALIDEYYTYWDAFDDRHSFYRKIVSSSSEVALYLASKNTKACAAGGLVDRRLYSQNELWIVYYSNNKKTLTAMNNAMKNKGLLSMTEDTRVAVRSTLVDLTANVEEEVAA